MSSLSEAQKLAVKVYGEDAIVTLDEYDLIEDEKLFVCSVVELERDYAPVIEITDEKALEMVIACLKVKAPKRGRPKKKKA